MSLSTSKFRQPADKLLALAILAGKSLGRLLLKLAAVAVLAAAAGLGHLWRGRGRFRLPALQLHKPNLSWRQHPVMAAATAVALGLGLIVGLAMGLAPSASSAAPKSFSKLAQYCNTIPYGLKQVRCHVPAGDCHFLQGLRVPGELFPVAVFACDVGNRVDEIVPNDATGIKLILYLTAGRHLTLVHSSEQGSATFTGQHVRLTVPAYLGDPNYLDGSPAASTLIRTK